MLEFFGIVFFLSIPAGLFYLGYRFQKNKRRVVQNTENTKLVEPEDKIILHEHDLAKWNYLGYTNCRYIDDAGKTLVSYPIFLFASKNNDKRRSYHCSSGAKDHTYVEKTVKPWAAGEGNIYSIVSGKDNYPSDYLKAYMLEHYSREWDNETKWWGQSDKAKYESAQTKQKKQRKHKVETQTENNVVTVEFGKQA